MKFLIFFLALNQIALSQSLVLLGSDPENNATQVLLNKTIELEFSESIDPLTIQGSIMVRSTIRGNLSGTIILNENILTFHPNGNYSHGEDIQVTVISSLKSISGLSPPPISLRFITLILPSPSTPPAFTNVELIINIESYLLDSSPVDLDLDGDVDIVYGTDVSSGWLENDGSGSFANHIIEQDGYYTSKVDAFDMDNDGDIDLVSKTSFYGIVIYENDGHQNFTLLPIADNFSGGELAFEDFDSNGFLDIVYSEEFPILKSYILYNQGGMVFQTDEIDTSGLLFKTVDIDSDGDIDIIQYEFPVLRVLIRDETTFTEHTISESSIYSFDTGDMDDDGDIDIVVCEFENLVALLNDGDLQFSRTIIEEGIGSYSAQVANIDGDTDLDIIIPDLQNFRAIINMGGMVFNPVEIKNAGTPSLNPFAISVEVVDLDKDGDLDFFISDTHQLKFYFSVPFAEAYPFSISTFGIVPLNFAASDWGDYDQDNDLDLIVTGMDDGVIKTILYENQFGLLKEVSKALPGVSHGDVDWGDFDLDGDLDLLLVGASEYSFSPIFPQTYVYKNENGEFSLHGPSILQLPKIHSGKARWADLNNDGRLDIIMSGWGFAGIYSSEQNGEFVKRLELSNWRAVGNLDVGDFDADGDLDFALSHNSNFGPLKVFINEGNWNFIESPVRFQSQIGGNLSWSDTDNDGDLDLVASGRFFSSTGSSTSSIMFYKNHNGLFLLDKELPTYVDANGTTSLADYNSDGKPDLIASHHNNNYIPLLTLFQNQGLGNLTKSGIDLPKIATRSATWADYDGDNDLDLFVGSALLNNNLNIPNTKPLRPDVIEVDSVRNNSIYLSWSTGNDLETEPLGLSYQIYMGTESGRQDIVSSHSNLTDGFRKVMSHGNAKGKSTSVTSLVGGTYFFGVQSIDASFAGSEFTPEKVVNVVSIAGEQNVCNLSSHTYNAYPAGIYTWEVSGGILESGQSTHEIRVKWGDGNHGFVAIKDGSVILNRIVVDIDKIPSGNLSGELTACTGHKKYQLITSDLKTVEWQVSGDNLILNQSQSEITIDWISSGNFEIKAVMSAENTTCFSVETLNVSIDAKPNFEITGPTIICTDQETIFKTSAAEPVWQITGGEIQSNNNQTISIIWDEPGDGIIAIEHPSQNGYCSSFKTIPVKILQSPPKPVLTQAGVTAILSTKSPSNYYEWYLDDQLVVIGEYIGVYANLSGNYTVKIFGENGCSSISDPLPFMVDIEMELSIHPNPTADRVTLLYTDKDQGEIEVQIYSSMGSLVKRVLSKKVNQVHALEIDVSDLVVGQYIVVLNKNSKLHSTTFLKK